MNSTETLRCPVNKTGWLFIPLGIIIYICLGTIYSWSVFRKPVEDLFNIGATQSGYPYMLFLVSYALFMSISGSFIDKYNPKLVIFTGGLFVGLGWILSGYAANIFMLTITYGLMAGGGVGIVYGVPIAVLSKWFPYKRGLVIGLTLLGFGLSPFVTAPIAQWLIDIHGPLPSFRFLGTSFFILISLLSLAFKFPPPQETTEGNCTPKNTRDFNTQAMLKSPNFYGLWSCFVIGTMAGLMTVGITSSVGEEIINLNAKDAALMVSTFAIFNGIGRPLFGWLTDKLYPLKAAVIAYSLLILSSASMLLAKEGSIYVYLISFSLLWLTLGGWLAIAPTATTFFFGLTNYSQNYGIVFSAYGVGAIIGVSTSGIIRDSLGSYIYVFYPMLFLGILGLGIALFLLKPSNN
ncbi:MAG: L-lactate MFS transporter [Bacillota bacterium]